MDFILNGQVHGQGLESITNGRLEAMRPYLNESGQARVTNAQGKAVAYPVQNELIGNSLLRKDEWKQMDQKLIEVKDRLMVGVQDLIGAGCVHNLANALGTMIFEYEDVSDMNNAVMDMAMETKSSNDGVSFSLKGLPIPIVHKEFQINKRMLEASRMRGNSLDTLQLSLATKKVAQNIENTLFNGSTVAYGGYNIYGYTTFPNRNIKVISASWDASGTTGADILADVQTMLTQARDAYHYGPFVMYISSNYASKMGNDYTSGYPKTIAQRLLELEELKVIKVAQFLDDNQVLLVEMVSDTVRMVRGFDPTVIQWQQNGTMQAFYKVISIMVPQIRADQDGNCGIVHGKYTA